MRCSASSLFGALLLVARGALAVRHNSRVSIMAPSDSVGDVTKTLLAASESVDSAANASIINRDMSAYLSTVSDSFAERICSQVPKGSNCSASVSAYMSRCAKQDCLTLQSLKYPLEAKYQPLTLPDPYQLEAAFILFKESDANPANSTEKRFWMRFRRGKNHSYFHDLVFNLLEKNVTRDADATDIENFASRYLYMATLYYKTYTNVDEFGASFFNKLSFTTGLFGWGIKRALKQIIRSNLPLDIGTEHSVSRLQHITSSYKDYMATQIPALPKFAKRFSLMVVQRLLATVAGYVDTPWYKKWYMKLKNFMVNRVFIPTKKFFNKEIREPSKALKEKVSTDTKDLFENKIGQGTVDFFNKEIRDPSKALKEKVSNDAKDLFENKIGQGTVDFINNEIRDPSKALIRKVSTGAEDLFENKIGQGTVDFINNEIRDPSKALIRKVYTEADDLFENKIGQGTVDFINKEIRDPSKALIRKVAKPLRKHRKGNVSDSGESEEISAVGESLESDNEMKTQESMNSESASTELPSDESEEESAAMVIQQPTLEEASQIALPAEEDSSELQETSDNYEASL
ncbi:rhoptry-associated protein 1 [Babesia caballi]|uniref:Rhoptry-associated protein 1 n=3 Tax=Babesia caballi TaxID=5871 RepID=A0AAV4LTD8_BABCB|nr:rhoptry-associated protein 1 [Babesia caballi]